MSEIPHRLQAILDECGVPYETIPHRPDYTAHEAAEDTHTPAWEFAKAVILRAGGQYAMAVLPADHHVNLAALREALGGKDVELASEDELAKVIPDCEVGAVPPFGQLYELPVYVSEDLAHRPRVTFSAGTHTAAIRMSYRDFARFVGGRVLDFSTPPLVEGS
jgi:Ala-tRNA(Pro) deacylase